MSNKGKGQQQDNRESVEGLTQEFKDILTGMGDSGAVVAVWRKLPGKKEVYLGQLDAGLVRENPLEVIKDHYGGSGEGGTYRAAIRDHGAYVKGGSATFAIAGKPKDPEEGEQLRETIEAMEERYRKELEGRFEKYRGMGSDQLVVELLRQNHDFVMNVRHPPAAAQAADPSLMAVNLFQAIQSANAPILAALLERQKGETMLDQLKGFAMLFRMVRELGGKGEEGGFGTIVKSVAPSFGKLVDLHVEETMRRHQVGAAAAPAPALEVNPVNGEPRWLPYLREGIPDVLQWASKGYDPQLRGGIVLEQLPEENLEPIYLELRRPDFVDEFLAVVPAAREHADWFRTFFGTILYGLTPEAEEDQEPGEPGTPQPGEIVVEGGAAPEPTPR